MSHRRGQALHTEWGLAPQAPVTYQAGAPASYRSACSRGLIACKRRRNASPESAAGILPVRYGRQIELAPLGQLAEPDDKVGELLGGDYAGVVPYSMASSAVACSSRARRISVSAASAA
jgi:hypothetical protein